MRRGRNHPATWLFWAVDHKTGIEKSHREQEHKSPLGPCCSLWKGKEELLLSRHRTSELSYFSYSFLWSPKKQLLHRSLS